MGFSKAEIERLLPQFWVNPADRPRIMSKKIEFWTEAVGKAMSEAVILYKLKVGMKLVLPPKIDSMLYFKERKFGPDDHTLVSVYKMSPEVVKISFGEMYANIDDDDYDEENADEMR